MAKKVLPGHYCKTPTSARSGKVWNCPGCGAGYRYVAESRNWLGRLVLGHWLQIRSGRS